MRTITKDNYFKESHLDFFGCSEILNIINHKISIGDFDDRDDYDNSTEWRKAKTIELFSEFIGSEPNHVSIYEDVVTNVGIIETIGSAYWILDSKIYRLSDHWGYVKECIWPYNGKEIYKGKELFLGVADMMEQYQSEALKRLVERKNNAIKI